MLRLSDYIGLKRNRIILILILLIFMFSLMVNIFHTPSGNFNDHTHENVTLSPASQEPATRSNGDNNDVFGGNISLAFFFDPGCECTKDGKIVMNYIAIKYPEVHQFWYNLSLDLGTTNYTKMIDFFEAYNVPGGDGGIRDDTPFVFIGDYYLHHEGIQNDSVSELIEKYQGMDVPLWPEWELAWTMHIAFFYDPTTQTSQSSLDNVQLLNSTWNRNFTHLIIHNYSLENPTNKLLLAAYFSEFNLSRVTQFNEPSEIYSGIFIGDDFLLNENISYDLLNRTVTKYSGRNTPLHDISPDLTGGKICIVFFYSPTCGDCHKARRILEDMKAKYPDVNVKEYNVGDPDNEILKQTYFDYYNVEEGGTLGVFIGDKYFVDPEALDDGIEAQIKRYEDGCDCADLEPDKEIVKDTFNSFTILAVMGAGLVDSINPCAIATLIFFIGYLSVTGRTKRQILIIGLAYTLGIFITYMVLGLGIYYLIAKSSDQIEMFARLLYPTMAAIVIFFGLYSLYDFFKARKGKKEEMKLQLPKPIKSLISRMIKHQVKLRYFTLIAILTGVIISMLEFLCTGQVYLPTIVLVFAEVPEFQGQAAGLLLLYNLMFVLPLIIIFVGVYFGMSSEQLQDGLDRHRPLIKLLTAIVFFCLAVWLIWYSMSIV